jgi:hypothetical protein
MATQLLGRVAQMVLSGGSRICDREVCAIVPHDSLDGISLVEVRNSCSMFLADPVCAAQSSLNKVKCLGRRKVRFLGFALFISTLLVRPHTIIFPPRFSDSKFLPIANHRIPHANCFLYPFFTFSITIEFTLIISFQKEWYSPSWL